MLYIYTFYSRNTEHIIYIIQKTKLRKGNNITLSMQSISGKSKISFDQHSKEHGRAVKNGDVNKNKIADHSWKLDKSDWENKMIIATEQNWTVRKKIIHPSSSDKNHMNNISYSLTEIWLPALKSCKGIEECLGAILHMSVVLASTWLFHQQKETKCC